jgi:hypothetical protein
MTDQIDLLTNEAIAQAEEGAPNEWLNHATSAVFYICATRGRGKEFTTDAVWARLKQTLGEDLAEPPEPRAMGAVIRKARAKGWCRATDRMVKSTRPECHGRRIQVWEITFQYTGPRQT